MQEECATQLTRDSVRRQYPASTCCFTLVFEIGTTQFFYVFLAVAGLG